MDGQIKINISKDFQSVHEGLCLELLHQGYKTMLITKIYDIDSEEDTLTAHFIDLMTNSPICNEWEIDIVSQFYLYSNKHTSGEVEAKYAPRIDFRFMKWFDKNRIVYYAEAKNLSEKDWTKKSGASVNASYYYKRYIATGISHLLTDYYPNNCILIAYVLNGDKNAVLSNLNNLISSNFTNYGIITKPEFPINDEYYISENTISGNKVVLKHLFLQLA